MKRKLRTIVVDGDRYAWTVRHLHKVLPEAPPLQGRCRELFSAFRAGYKACPLRVQFDDSKTQQAGYPSAGVVWMSDGGFEANLNTPSVAAALIRAALQRGWRPLAAKQPFVIEDGFAFAQAAV